MRTKSQGVIKIYRVLPLKIHNLLVLSHIVREYLTLQQWP